MTRAAVMGGGERAAGWATRLLAAGFDVSVDDGVVADAVRSRWPAADRLGLFPHASLERLTVGHDHDVMTASRLVHLVGDAVPPGHPGPDTLVATDITATAHEPVHLVPLVEVDDPVQGDALIELYASIGMAPRRAPVSDRDRARLATSLTALAEDDGDALIAILRALRATPHPAGVAAADHEARRLAAAAVEPWRRGTAVPAPLELYRTRVEPDWVDYNAHMTEAAYLTAAGWASDALFRYIGDDEAYRAAGHSFYTVETHILYLAEMALHEPLAIDTQILGVDAKRVHLVHLLRHGTDGHLVATCEQMLVHVDMHAGRSVPILPGVAAALAAIRDAHAHLAVPDQVGSVMRLPTPRT